MPDLDNCFVHTRIRQGRGFRIVFFTLISFLVTIKAQPDFTSYVRAAVSCYTELH